MKHSHPPHVSKTSRTQERPRTFPAIAILPTAIGFILVCVPAMAQDTNAGQAAFNRACRTCHTTKEGDNRLGPSLHGVIGRKAGSLPNYNNFSDSMKKADLVWDKSNLERFIANPDQVVPGNTMKPFAGMASADERAKIVGFLDSVAK
jgi:cytochrome c